MFLKLEKKLHHTHKKHTHYRMSDLDAILKKDIDKDDEEEDESVVEKVKEEDMMLKDGVLRKEDDLRDNDDDDAEGKKKDKKEDVPFSIKVSLETDKESDPISIEIENHDVPWDDFLAQVRHFFTTKTFTSHRTNNKQRTTTGLQLSED